MEHVTFRVRALKAEPGGRGEPSQAAVEVHLGRGEPSQAAIEVNLALYDNALRARLLDRIEEVARAIVSAAGGTLRWEVDYALPALVNDDHVTGALERAAQRVIGQANIVKDWRNRFSDDFGLFMAAAPGCLMLTGLPRRSTCGACPPSCAVRRRRTGSWRDRCRATSRRRGSA